MCESQADGGARCAAHTRPQFEAAIAGLGDAATNPSVYNTMYRDRWELGTDAEAVADAVREYASTPQGCKAVADYIAEHKKAHGNSNKFAMFLTRERRKGEELAEARKEARAAIKKAKIAADRKMNRSSGVLTRSPKANETHNMQVKFPGVAEMWDVEKNGGILPTEVTPNVNKDIWLTCREGHSFSGRGNNVVAPIRDGRRFYPMCPECEGRKPRQFAATQEELTSLTEALGDDPDAFNALPPALRYELMAKMGILRGGENSMNRNIAMSIVHGDLTLKDVVTANAFAAIAGQVREHREDDDDLADITNIDVDMDDTQARSTNAAVDQVLASSGVLSMIDDESELANSVRRANNEALWERAYDNETDLDAYSAFLDSRRGASPQADAVIDRFQAELAAVRSNPLPEGYQAVRVTAEGKTITLEPTLAQRRFADLVEDKRRFMNWSGTGAGKTLSTTLAVQASGARETLVVCPKAVIDQWEAEFKNGFPENTDVRIGLPKAGEELPPPPPGVNRVWITNYDQFQGDTDTLSSRVNPLADRVDAVVFDEIHMAKASDEASTSQRRRALQEFTDRAGRANDDLVVVGASATPVVNNLEEAKSVLRLVEGPESKSFPTAPTMKNAATAYSRISAAGVRHMPTYPTLMTRNEETVDITSNIHKVQARVNAMRLKAGGGRVTPAMMDRALLPEKLPVMVAKIKSNRAAQRGPSLVYTEYTAGMVAPMKEAFEREGLRVGTYTGDESDADRKKTLQAFNRGELDVLIGSRPIGTGVDGLQHTSSHILIPSAPWTAAADDQLAGRLQRRGQARDVQIDYILTEAKAGDMRWSWCKDNRLKRIHFKRDIANAAVDGIMPDGTFESSQHGAERALGSLKEMASSVALSNAA